MREAMCYQRLDDGEVRCGLCAHNCRIKDGALGRCRVRINRGGTLYSLVADRIVSAAADPIEKKPLFHFLPGSLSFSIATVGCNFRCRHCQNHEISQYPVSPERIPGQTVTPEAIVAEAVAKGCASISYTYVEPTIFFELAVETAEAAAEAGLKNVFVSNGYTSKEAARRIAPFLDADNIDLKAFSDSFYKEYCGARLAPVLETIETMKALGVWVEVTTLVIPGLNDDDRQLNAIARFLHGIDPAIPWHVSRFHPAYHLTDRPPTPAATVRRAREIGLAEGLLHVYTGNLPDGGEDTLCPACGAVVIARHGYHTDTKGLTNGACAACGHPIAGVW